MSMRWIRKFLVRQRLALWSALILMLTMVIIGALLMAALEVNLRREVDEALLLRAQHVEHGIAVDQDGTLSPAGVGTGLADLALLDEITAPGIYVQVLDHDGTVLLSSANLPGGGLPVPADLAQQTLAGRQTYVTVPIGRERVRLLGRPVLAEGQLLGAVIVGESLHFLDVTLRDLRWLLEVATFLAALLALAGGWWLRRQAMHPVAEVTRVARDIAATGRFERRIAVPQTQDELRDLAATFNEMLARLERTFRRQRDFLADASHELRGPLTVIRGNLDLLQMDLPEAERRDSAAEATEEVKRMSRLVSDLLFLATEDAQERLEHQPVPLHELVSAAAERARSLDAGKHAITIICNDPTIVQGDRDRLGQMLWNLVENALRYTDPGGTVTLGLHNHGPVAELTVADTGVGIAAEHLPHIFERFYRVDRARSHRHGSTGLGLAIVKQAAEAHGGQVRVRSEPDSGATFTVALPTWQVR
jgi:two-component system OmpR family sensor kinase